MSPHAEPPLPQEAETGRVWLEDLQPCLEHGQFPIKRTVGEQVTVSVDAVTDGHERLALVLRHRPAGADAWIETPMRHLQNDRWQASFGIEELTPYEYSVAGWLDPFASWLDGLQKKVAAGQEVALELEEGRLLLEAAAARAPAGPERTRVQNAAELLPLQETAADAVALVSARDLARLMQRHADRSRQSVYPRTLRVDVARPRARTGAWYEFFPRSAAAEVPDREGLRAAAARLPAVAGMGFDVAYLPPIHPIGQTFRKGPNNTLTPGPDDPGSPWAIGAETGGHTAVHPDLGALADFRFFCAEARQLGLEVALDLAFQCSPDHPWVTEHPSFFRRRPDGSIQYAENPPKKYQDIYPLDFDTADWRELWQALLEVTLFWCEQGVGIFRVDNPHTKPIRFWQWLIARVKQQYPETVFLSEAFTRPKLMYALAKAGFDQSYTYFTWRNTGHELRAYLEELTQPPVSDFFRPNFFANTPDILPQYLQFGGKPAFRTRLVLAATLAASYGIYSGFELYENQAVPGSEEYHDSEKYQVRVRDWDQPDTLAPLIGRLNAIRRENPALQRNTGLRFHPTDNEHLLCYSKSAPDGDGPPNVIVVVVNLDPHHRHTGWVELPIADLEVGPRDVYQLHDLLDDQRYLWQGARNFVELDPALPAHVFRLRRHVRTEHDFDYYM
jgi:starch synthase (maltosyl-transferring)